MDIQSVNTLLVSADHGCDFHPLANHMTKLRTFTKEENRDFSAFRFSLQLMLEQALTNLLVCLMISQKNTYKCCTNELACCIGYYVSLVFRKMYLK